MPTVTLTTGLSLPLFGIVNIAATALDPTASMITVQWDISQHLDGNSASMTASADISLDGGLTWNFLCGAGRSKGSTDVGMAFVTQGLPGVGNALRMVRASLTTSASVTTSMQLVIS